MYENELNYNISYKTYITHNQSYILQSLYNFYIYIVIHSQKSIFFIHERWKRMYVYDTYQINVVVK